ncbi:uncharacterized protein B0H64DRAFT_446704 [Chaetomium fimeti]|uniref:Uncharacterized protein n=1 Tax=Chaetomium fimeti TaxID=1854472 RepID=A0AAE0H6J5_9PEZI|nr:hypothetical protein B0H64DRAFT_446704 [Chaetomium fimeti]
MPRDTAWRIRGTIVPIPTSREDATRFANLAANRRSTWSDLALNIFSDASVQYQSNVGGYAVVHRPLMPSDGGSDEGNHDHDEFVEAAWPIDPLPDSNLGEMLAIAKSIAVAIQQVKHNRAAFMGKRVNITIFSDSRVSLGVLNGDKLRGRFSRLEDQSGANCAAMRVSREGKEMGQEAWGEVVGPHTEWYKLDKEADSAVWNC